MELIYKTEGVCAREIKIILEDNIVKNISFTGGCSGNLVGLSKLVEGMKVPDVIEKLKGINCGGRGTSCPDQLTKALEGLNKTDS